MTKLTLLRAHYFSIYVPPDAKNCSLCMFLISIISKFKKFLAVNNKICTYGTFKWLGPSSPPFAMLGEVAWGICFSYWLQMWRQISDLNFSFALHYFHTNSAKFEELYLL